MKNSKNFGKALRDLRISKNIKIEQISKITKINQQYFESFEKGDFSMNNEVYIRLFLIEYIKCIDQSQLEKILNQFNDLNGAPTKKPLTFIPADVASENDEELKLSDDEFLNIQNYTPKKIAIIITTFIFIILIFRLVLHLSKA